MVENDFACYHCYRVRPFTALPARQVRELHARGDRHEGTPRSKRCCIECAIAGGLYKARTRIAVPKKMWTYTDMASIRPRLDSTLMFYCDACNDLKPFDPKIPHALVANAVRCHARILEITSNIAVYTNFTYVRSVTGKLYRECDWLSVL